MRVLLIAIALLNTLVGPAFAGSQGPEVANQGIDVSQPHAEIRPHATSHTTNRPADPPAGEHRTCHADNAHCCASSGHCSASAVATPNAHRTALVTARYETPAVSAGLARGFRRPLQRPPSS